MDYDKYVIDVNFGEKTHKTMSTYLTLSLAEDISPILCHAGMSSIESSCHDFINLAVL